MTEMSDKYPRDRHKETQELTSISGIGKKDNRNEQQVSQG